MEQYTKSPGSRLTATVKSIFSLLPPSLPTTLYRTVLSRPLFRPFTNAVARMMIPECITLPEGNLFLNKKDTAISGGLITGIYEPYELELFRQHLRPGMTVIDIGANIGIYTVIAASKVGSTGRVFSYEPEKENLSFLEKNIAANNLVQARAMPTALSDHNGTQTLFLAGDNKGSHSFVDTQNGHETVSVPVETLDESLRKAGISKVDLIKIDTEGAEPVIFEGMKQTLAHNRALILFTEIYPSRIRALKKDPLEYLSTLHQLGFTLSIINEDKKILVPLLPQQFTAFLESFPNGESPRNLLCIRR